MRKGTAVLEMINNMETLLDALGCVLKREPAMAELGRPKHRKLSI